MLVEFSVANFKSFKNLQNFSMEAAPISSKFSELDKENVALVGKKLKLLKSKAVYGANASGKSNLVQALSFFKEMIIFSVRNEEIILKDYKPFLLSTETRELPGFFQGIFVVDGKQFRYGFEVFDNRIVSEWLFGPAEKRQVAYFTREGQNITVNSKQFAEGKPLMGLGKEVNDIFRENSLFLTAVSAFNGTISKSITQFFKGRFWPFQGIHDQALFDIAVELMANVGKLQEELEMLQNADIGIVGLRREEKEGGNNYFFLPSQSRPREFQILTERTVFDEEGNPVDRVEFAMTSQESEGTKKLFSIIPVLLPLLRQGGVLLIDEYDARLHPVLTRSLIELFHSEATNPGNAQLIFVTHNTNLLNPRLLRRDQISFAEKDRFGATHLFSLVELKGVRNDASFEKDYIKGKYGAIPFLGNLNALFETK